MSDRTVRSWLADARYRAFVGGLRDQVLAEATGRLTVAATRAVAVLEELLESDQDGIKLRAATSILDGLIRAREHGELSALVAAVEGGLAVGDHPENRSRRWGD